MSLKSIYSTLAAGAVACLLAVLLVVPSIWAFGRIMKSAEARKHTYEVTLQAGALLTALSDAQASERGYVLTGDESFLAPYLAVRDKIPGQLSHLRLRFLEPAAHTHLEAMTPLVEANLAEMSRVIALRRNLDAAAAIAAVNSSKGDRLIGAIREEMSGFLLEERSALERNEAAVQSNLNLLFVFILVAGLGTLLVALAIVYLTHRQAQQKVKNQVHLETRNLLGAQEEINDRLRTANATLEVSEAKLAVTLDSIGDAVIATDAKAMVQVMNPVAESLTGWTLKEALGRPVGEVFQIINQETRQIASVPVTETLAKGTIQGLANHTLLISRQGTECAIADSCAPIRNPQGEVVGAVLVFRDVSEEYAAQAILRDNTAMIQTILGTVVDGIITVRARGSLIETVNPAAKHMFGYAGYELIGQAFSKLIPDLDPRLLDGSRDSTRALEEAEAIGLGHEMEGQRKDGRRFPVEIAIGHMELKGERYFTGILRDISTRKRIEEDLLKAGALQSAIFNSANFSSIATDAKGVIQIFNVGAEEMLGYSALEVMNTITPAEFSDPQEVIERANALSLELATPISPGFEALAFKASRGIEDIYELTLIRKDGSRFPAVLSVTALRDSQGSIIGYLLIGTDNSARKLVEAERERLDHALKDKNIELEAAVLVAEQANLAKSEFLSSMSHELRSPLNAILGFAQLMDSASPAATPSQKSSIDRILHAGWYLLELINEILDLAVIESGKLSLSEEPVSLAEIMFDCQSMIEPQGQQRHIQLTFPTFAAPSYVQADRVRLKQVLINLLSNAIKYNHAGGTVEVKCVTVRPGRIRISVKDSGEGLSTDQLRQLFQPFNRLGREHGSEEGTGIGLVMSKLLVELMGGQIGVESTVGVGSVFWYELNTAEAPMLQDALAEVKPDLVASAREHQPARTVLCVEDNPANLDLIQQLIGRRPSLNLLSAGEAKLGIKLALEHLPSVILMDINLPGMDGLEAMEILRNGPTTAHIPVIAVSANAMVGDIQKGVDAGFFRYITKPINVPEFMKALDDALELSENRMVETGGGVPGS